jgi:TPR repeat protein
VPLPKREILIIEVWLLGTKTFEWTGPGLIGVNVTVKVQEPPGERIVSGQFSEPTRKKDHRNELLTKAQRGDANSQMWLATAYEQGWFGERNVAEALKWFRKSAAKGNPDAQDSLGQMYEDGEGVKHSYVLAAKWYRKAAEHVPDLGGAGQGRNNLGLLYLYGRGVPIEDSTKPSPIPLSPGSVG